MIPDINTLPPHPILHTLASKQSWVRVEFFGKEAPTRDEIYRTIELLCMMYDGWPDDAQPTSAGSGDNNATPPLSAVST